MGALFFIVFVLMIAVWLTLRNRIAELESRLSRAEVREKLNIGLRIAELTKRIFQLEL